MVTIITPWNFPCQLLLEPMAAAIAAGNACVIKPSQLSGAFSELMGVRGVGACVRAPRTGYYNKKTGHARALFVM